MMDWRLERRINQTRARWRHWRWLVAAAGLWCVAAMGCGVAWLILNYTGLRLAQPMEWILGGTGLALLIVTWRVGRLDRDLSESAKRIERRFPELNSGLLAATEIQPDVRTGRVSYLQDMVIGQVLAHSYEHNWRSVVSWRALVGAHLLHWSLLALLLLALWQVQVAAKTPRPFAAGKSPVEESLASKEFAVEIEPGSTEVERGTSLLVVARFSGDLPPDATLVARGGKQGEVRIPMAKALEDPVFGGSVPNVQEPLEYAVEYGTQHSEKFQVGVFEYPRLVRADARLRFPAYTSQEDRTVQDVRQLAAVVGTKVTLMLELNKSVATARLVASPTESFQLEPCQSDGPRRYAVTILLERTLRLNLEAVDDQGRKNKIPAEFVLTALANRPPDLKLAAPGRDTQVSPLEELELKAKAFDDFGLRRVGLTWMLAGNEEQELVLAQDVRGKERLELAHLVDFESLQVEPDQLLSYYVWAEDTGPDGQVRRTESDMYFAEVRPFEEIFRQGQQPPEGGAEPSAQQANENAGQAEQLAELQKEIINATWKILRRETADQVSDAFDSDVGLLIESQSKALAQAEQLAEKLRDAKSKKHIDDARRFMNEAIKHMLESREQKSETPLRLARDAEQSARQALLRLRAREHEVVRSRQSSQRSSSSTSSSSRSQQQLDQLELKKNENRYETESAAKGEEDPAEREMRQVLNRLKELARRQEDLNERLKEMQAALQAAETPEQKEELQRQLKRLQEEQEQMLRDTEELQNRLEEPQNAERMADSRQQLEDARERVRQSAEALREGLVSQATAAGTRAQEQFEQLRDDFRQQTSSQFQRDVRELNEQARHLDERQQQLAQELKDLEQPKDGAKSLREEGGREKLVEGLGEQRQQAEKLLDRMRQTIQDAEGPQPLLAEQLYDSVRTAQQRNLDQSLETAREALRRGLMEPARQQEESAREAIHDLRAGVERATQSVLGDEGEALRRAQDQLNDLMRQLNQEIAQNTDASGSAPPKESPEPTPPGQQAAAGEKSGSEKSGSEKSGSEKSGSEKSGSEKSGGEKSGGEKGQGKPGQQAGAGESRRDSPTVGENQSFAPFSGEGFREWSDRLRDVEEMLGDPQLSAEAARIRERARALRAESKRHSVPPNWDLVELEVAKPLEELRQRVHIEVLKRSKTEELVPLDRDPVPAEFREQVRKYYERLGAGQ